MKNQLTRLIFMPFLIYLSIATFVLITTSVSQGGNEQSNLIQYGIYSTGMLLLLSLHAFIHLYYERREKTEPKSH